MVATGGGKIVTLTKGKGSKVLAAITCVMEDDDNIRVMMKFAVKAIELKKLGLSPKEAADIILMDK